MNAEYYSVRRLCPYRGIFQMVDVGIAYAYSEDGLSWRAFCKNLAGRYSRAGIWVEGEGGQLQNCSDSDTLIEALQNRPMLPFALQDTVELWLLNKNTGLPLALLDSERPSFPAQKVMDPTWYPCVLTDTSFRADCLATRDAARHAKAWPELHRDVLAKQVNQAARPLPAAQWFTRSSDGGGVGMEGLRVEAGQLGRQLNKTDFPELLLDEVWKEQTEAELVREYHAWQAPLLLAHSGLSRSTRVSLEQSACKFPAKLLEIYRLIPKFVDEQAIQVALVEARLERASRTIFLGTE